MEYKYDVFISYSSKDYMDNNGKTIAPDWQGRKADLKVKWLDAEWGDQERDNLHEVYR